MNTIPSLLKNVGAAIFKRGVGETPPGNSRPPWNARSVRVAMVMVVLGSGLYLKDLWISAPSVPVEENRPATTAPSHENDTAPGLPATLRLGASYIGGFLVGWGFRRFIGLSILVSTASLALVAIGRKTGWIDLDWTLLENQVHRTTAWFQAEAGMVKALLESCLPSAGTAGVGAVLGFRRK